MTAVPHRQAASSFLQDILAGGHVEDQHQVGVQLLRDGLTARWLKWEQADDSAHSFERDIKSTGIRTYAAVVKPIVESVLLLAQQMGDDCVRYIEHEPLPGMFPHNPHAQEGAERTFVVLATQLHHKWSADIEHSDLFGYYGTYDLRGIIVEQVRNPDESSPVRLHLLRSDTSNVVEPAVLKCFSIDPTGVTDDFRHGARVGSQYFYSMGLFLPDASTVYGRPGPTSNIDIHLKGEGSRRSSRGFFTEFCEDIDKLPVFLHSFTDWLRKEDEGLIGMSDIV